MHGPATAPISPFQGSSVQRIVTQGDAARRPPLRLPWAHLFLPLRGEETLACWVLAYALYLVLAAPHPDTALRFGAVMLYFVGPLTVVTLVMVTVPGSRIPI